MDTKKERRRIYFIEKGFQARFILKFCALIVLGTLLTGITLYLLSRSTATVSFENTRAVVKTTADFILPILIQTIVIVTLIVGIATIILTLFVSHKIGGPLYRLKKQMKIVATGDLRGDFSIRKSDQLQDLASSLDDMIKNLRQVHLELKDQWQVLANSWQKLASEGVPAERSQDAEELARIIEDIGRKLEYFKA